ncbi:MAG: efflux transporter periplasmic adaptor subunit, partial [Nitrospirota bacterium]
MISRRRIILVGAAAAVILAIVYGFMPKPISVETVVVKRGHMRVAIEAEGQTRVIDRFIVSAPVAGYALRIYLNIGDPVSKGDSITELEPLRSNVLDPRSRAEAKARVAAAEASLLGAKESARAAGASADFAKKEAERIRQLFSDALVPRERLDMAEADMQRTDAAMRSSEFAVEVARHEKDAALTALKYSAAHEPGGYPERVV